MDIKSHIRNSLEIITVILKLNEMDSCAAEWNQLADHVTLLKTSLSQLLDKSIIKINHLVGTAKELLSLLTEIKNKMHVETLSYRRCIPAFSTSTPTIKLYLGELVKFREIFREHVEYPVESDQYVLDDLTVIDEVWLGSLNARKGVYNNNKRYSGSLNINNEVTSSSITSSFSHLVSKASECLVKLSRHWDPGDSNFYLIYHDVLNFICKT